MGLKSLSPTSRLSPSAWKQKHRKGPTKRVPIRDYPRLTRFYGLGPQELASTPQNILWIYADALPRLEAEEQLSHIQASVFPHTEPDAAKHLHEALVVLAGWALPEPRKIDVSTQEGKEVLAGLGIGVAS